MNVLTATTTAVRTVVLTVAPSGGQGTARRNALAAVRAGDIAARERAEALEAFAQLQAPGVQPATG